MNPIRCRDKDDDLLDPIITVADAVEAADAVKLAWALQRVRSSPSLHEALLPSQHHRPGLARAAQDLGGGENNPGATDMLLRCAKQRAGIAESAELLSPTRDSEIAYRILVNAIRMCELWGAVIRIGCQVPSTRRPPR